MKKKAISKIARGKLAKVSVFQGRKEIRRGDMLQNLIMSKQPRLGSVPVRVLHLLQTCFKHAMQ